MNFWLLLACVASQVKICRPIPLAQELFGTSMQRWLASPTIVYMPSGTFPGAGFCGGLECVRSTNDTKRRKPNPSRVAFLLYIPLSKSVTLISSINERPHPRARGAGVQVKAPKARNGGVPGAASAVGCLLAQGIAFGDRLVWLPARGLD